MKTAQWRYKDDQGRRVCTAWQRIYDRLYLHIDHPSMTTSGAKWFAMDSYIKLVSLEMGSCRIVGFLLSAAIIFEHGTSNRFIVWTRNIGDKTNNNPEFIQQCLQRQVKLTTRYCNAKEFTYDTWYATEPGTQIYANPDQTEIGKVYTIPTSQDCIIKDICNISQRKKRDTEKCSEKALKAERHNAKMCNETALNEKARDPTASNSDANIVIVPNKEHHRGTAM